MNCAPRGDKKSKTLKLTIHFFGCNSLIYLTLVSETINSKVQKINGNLGILIENVRKPTENRRKSIENRRKPIENVRKSKKKLKKMN